MESPENSWAVITAKYAKHSADADAGIKMEADDHVKWSRELFAEWEDEALALYLCDVAMTLFGKDPTVGNATLQLILRHQRGMVREAVLRAILEK